MKPEPCRVLVLCTGNSARSIMAEALINVLGQGRWLAYSAGSQPMGRVNPLAAAQAQTIGYPPETMRSKSWDEFAGPDAPVMDLVITVCDSAAGESCPLWRGTPLKVHWGFADPSHVQGTDAEKQAAFAHTFGLIRQKIEALVALPFEQMNGVERQQALEKIAPQSGETSL